MKKEAASNGTLTFKISTIYSKPLRVKQQIVPTPDITFVRYVLERYVSRIYLNPICFVLIKQFVLICTCLDIIQQVS